MAQHIYERVYLLGVDGAGNFFRKTSTPNIDRIFESGAYSDHVLTSIPTISAQCWGSMLHGVSPLAHRMTNSSVGSIPLDDNFPYPSVFKLVRQAFPKAALSSISNWNPINYGIIEPNLSVKMGTGDDDETAEQVMETIRQDDPKLLFVQFDSVDGAGHHYGYGTQGHLQQITYVDGLIGKIYDTAVACGRMENTLFLVTADHGGTPGGSHGGKTDAEKIVSFFAKGESVNPGEFGYMEIRDTAAIIAHAFGLKQPELWSARIPDGLFCDAESFMRGREFAPHILKRYSDHENKPVPTKAGEALGDKVDLSGLICGYELQGNLKERVKNTEANFEGKLYYTDGFFGKAATLDDAVINLPDILLGKDNFTVCTFLKLPKQPADKSWCIFSTKADDDDCDTGLCLKIENEKLVSIFGLSDSFARYETALPENYENNYFHLIVSYDRSNNEYCVYYDFCLDSDWEAEFIVEKDFLLNGRFAHIGNHCPITLQDLLVFDHKLSDEEILSLCNYYEQ